MEYPRVLVLGGSGFIGRNVVAELVACGHQVVVPARRRERAKQLITLPTCEVVEADINDRKCLAALIAQADAVINLVGILHSRRGDPYGPDFAKAHVDLPRAIAQAMKAARATGAPPRRLLHVSALGVGPHAPSMYLRSKTDGEAAIRGELSGLSGDAQIPWTIFRPSVVFGPDDRFMNMFASLARWFPLLPIGAADAQFQPVFVNDVAQAIVHSLQNPATFDKTYLLCGPKTYRLRQLVELAAAFSGHRRPVIGLPQSLARLQAMLLEHAPGGPLLSRDNLDSMRVDNVAPKNWAPAPELGIPIWTPLEQQAAIYLSPNHERRPIDVYRKRAHR